MNDGEKKSVNNKIQILFGFVFANVFKIRCSMVFLRSLCQRDFKMFIQLVLKWLLHFTVALLFWIHFICSWIPESSFSLPFFFSFSFSCFYDRSGIYQKLRTSFTIKAVMHVEVSLSIGIFTKASNWLLYQIK